MITQFVSAELKVMACPECGITYGVPTRIIEEAQRRGNHERSWYCPSGHSLGCGEGEVQRLRKSLAAAEGRQAAAEAARNAAQADLLRAQEKQARAERKLRRVAKGVCPDCHRSFTNLARHMATKHTSGG